MDNLTRIVKTEISRQYKSVRQFAFAVNIPLSTINSALHNGIGGSSFDTVVQICQTLGIRAISSDASFYLTEDTQQLLDQYAQLDDYGRHTIASVMKVEYDRCSTQGARSTSGSDYELRPSVNVSQPGRLLGGAAPGTQRPSQSVAYQTELWQDLPEICGSRLVL